MHALIHKIGNTRLQLGVQKLDMNTTTCLWGSSITVRCKDLNFPILGFLVYALCEDRCIKFHIRPHVTYWHSSIYLNNIHYFLFHIFKCLICILPTHPNLPQGSSPHPTLSSHLNNYFHQSWFVSNLAGCLAFSLQLVGKDNNSQSLMYKKGLGQNLV